MTFNKKLLISFFAFVLTSCATSNVVKINDEYIIFKEGGTPVLGQTFHLSDLKSAAYKEANNTCLKDGGKVIILSEEQTPMSIGVFARFEMKFKCE